MGHMVWGPKAQKIKSSRHEGTKPWRWASVDFWWMNIWIVGCGRGGGIESAGGNYPLKLPPQLPTVSGRAQQCGCVMRKRGISTPSLFPLLPPSRPLLYEANRRRDHRGWRNITHHYNPMQLNPSSRPAESKELQDDAKFTPKRPYMMLTEKNVVWKMEGLQFSDPWS